MSKYYEVSEDIEKIFNSVLEKTSIPQWVEFKLIGNDTIKDVYQVKKLSELYEYLSEGTSMVIIINCVIFDELEEKQKELLVEEALTSINVNPDNDKISVEPFDFSTYSGMLNKYGNEEMIRLKETVISLYQAKKQREDELKETKKKK